MTRNEFDTLTPDDFYKFIFYHGRVEYGILIEEGASGKIYLIDCRHIKDYKTKQIQEAGEEISIGTIARWERIEGEAFRPKTNATIIHGTPKATKLVIIGAGASFGFPSDEKDTRRRPPLANNLFSDCYDTCLDQYPGAKSIAAEALLSKDIEAYFQKKWEQVLSSRDNLLLGKLINVQYYLHDLFLQISKESSRVKQNNYNILMNLIHDYTVNTGEHVLIVNFNYDTLLDEAMKRNLQYSFCTPADYVDYEKRKALVFRPHGSCNLVKKFDKRILAHLSKKWNVNSVKVLSVLLYEEKIAYDLINDNLEDKYTLLNREEVIHVAADPDEILYLPQLLLPFKSKDDFIMPPEQEALLEHLLRTVDEILVLGWKGTEAKFQQLLGKKLGHKPIKLTAITKGDQTISQEFSRSLPRATFDAPFQTFSDYMKFCVDENSLFGHKEQI